MPRYDRDPRLVAAEELRDALETFARIGRWGTCGACPSSAGRCYPEFCEYTSRYDHQLTSAMLMDQFERCVREEKERVS